MSRTKEVYNIGLNILKRLTIVLSFLLAIILKQILNIRQEVNVNVIVIVAALRAANIKLRIKIPCLLGNK